MTKNISVVRIWRGENSRAKWHEIVPWMNSVHVVATELQLLSRRQTYLERQPRTVAVRLCAVLKWTWKRLKLFEVERHVLQCPTATMTKNVVWTVDANAGLGALTKTFYSGLQIERKWTSTSNSQEVCRKLTHYTWWHKKTRPLATGAKKVSNISQCCVETR